MRILQVDKFLRRQGGAAGYMLDLAELQRSAGHDVEFFSMADETNQPATYEDLFPPYVELEPPPSSITGRLGTAATMIWSRKAENGMRAVVEDFRPDVVHVHNIYHQLSPSILRPLAKRDIPVVMTAHDFKLVCPSYRLLDGDNVCEACIGSQFHHAARRRCKDGSLGASVVLAVESSAHRLGNAYDPIRTFICPSRFLLNKLREGGVYPDRLKRIPNFVDTDSIQTAEGPGEGYVFTGRLSREKGVDTLIEAVAMVDHAELVIVGDGPEREALESLAGRLAPERIQFCGHVDKDEVQTRIRSARAAVLPARWHENMPLSIIEAHAAAVPMVVTNLGGSPELIDEGKDGFIVAPDDPHQLAAALRKLEDDPAGAHRMGLAGRAKVADQFSAGPHLGEIMATYAAAGATDQS